MQNELEKKEKVKQRLKKIDTVIERSETDLRFLPDEKHIDNRGIKKTIHAVKRSKKDVGKPLKSLKTYIEQKWNKVLAMILCYIIFIGAILSTPIVINHFGVKSKNQTEKERFITGISSEKYYESTD